MIRAKHAPEQNAAEAEPGAAADALLPLRFSRRAAAQAATAAAAAVQGAEVQPAGDGSGRFASGTASTDSYFRSLQAELQELTSGDAVETLPGGRKPRGTGRRARRLAGLSGQVSAGVSGGGAETVFATAAGKDADSPARAPPAASDTTAPAMQTGEPESRVLIAAHSDARLTVQGRADTIVASQVGPESPALAAQLDQPHWNAHLPPVTSSLQEAAAVLPCATMAATGSGDDWLQHQGCLTMSPPAHSPTLLTPPPPPPPPRKAVDAVLPGRRSPSPLMTPPLPLEGPMASPTAAPSPLDRLQRVDSTSPVTAWADACTGLSAEPSSPIAAGDRGAGSPEKSKAVPRPQGLLADIEAGRQANTSPAARALSFSPSRRTLRLLSPWQRQQRQLQQECSPQEAGPPPPAPLCAAGEPAGCSPSTPPPATAGAALDFNLCTPRCTISVKQVCPSRQ